MKRQSSSSQIRDGLPLVPPSAESITLVESLLCDLSNLPHRSHDRLDALLRRTKMILTKVFGPSSSYLKDLEDAVFYPSVYYSGMPDSTYETSWKSGKTSLTNLLKTALEEIQLMIPPAQALRSSTSLTESPNAAPNVFVVHGHDDEMKLAVARILEALNLKPIILHEQPDRGRTIIEKFIDHSSVQFAIVLFSPDDMAYESKSLPNSARPRARQNVVLELGFFLGSLGREKVLVLHRPVPNFDMPSDYAGVLFKPFDSGGVWRFELVRELHANGFDVDANQLIK